MAPDRNNLDDLFRKRFEKSESSFDRENWERLDAMLQLENRNRRRKIIFFILCGVMLALLSSLAIFEITGNRNDISSEQNNIIHKIETDSSKRLNHSIENGELASTTEGNSPAKELNNSDKVSNQMNSTTGEANHTVHAEEDVRQLPAPSDSFTGVRRPSDLNGKPKHTPQGHSSGSPALALSVSKKKNQKITHQTNKTEVIPDATISLVKSSRNIFTMSPLLSKTNLIPFDNSWNDSLHLLNLHIVAPSITAEEKNSHPYSIIFSAGAKFRSSNTDNGRKIFLSPAGGIELQKSLTSSLSIGTGIFYCEVSGLNLRDTSTQVNYFLDQESSQQYLTIHALQIISIPISLQYKIATHSLFGGVDANYLLTSRSDYAYMNSTAQGTESGGIINARGYVDGINTLSFDFHLGYEFSFAKKFGASISYQQGISNLTKPGYFAGVDHLHDHSLNIMIHYKIL